MLSTYAKINAYLATRGNDDEGATAIEYALIVGLVSVVLVGILALFGDKFQDFVDGINFGSGN